ncbi:hypothetical protein [Dactylosporangium sp. NPDC006015]|uniref:restriction system modified-DNA reader domain-containing protein n=1 Tax=Dactylosporangium sp. NPDC006015 TaxID=3154576 RepID=UPI0033B42AD9
MDDDVYDWLQKRAKPFVDTPNSVLRRELGIDNATGVKAGPANASSSSVRRPVGELAPLLASGDLRVEEELEWKRRGGTHRGFVTADGCLELEDGRVFTSPSGAGKALAGYDVNGRRCWRRSRDGVDLSALFGQ